MEDATTNVDGANMANTSESAQIPIAKLSPATIAPASIKAVVALIWPYSSLTNSITLLLAEPNFRLRKEGGQVRVQFSGSSGKAVAESGIGSGDVITLNLEGVEWLPNHPTARIPGRSIEWELKYSERLLMEVRSEETQESKTIDIDHPMPAQAVEPPPEEPTVEPLVVVPEVFETTPLIPRSRKILEVEAENREEWQSPAFVKRARTSYGLLYGSSDIFAEDTGKSRRKSRLGWRYTSRSPSPTPSVEVKSVVDEAPVDVPQVPDMTDEGCQTNGDGEALPEVLQSSTAAPNITASTSFDNPISSFNEANTDSITQTQPDESSEEDINIQDWTSVNNQPRDQESDLGTEQPLPIEIPLAVDESEAPYGSSHPKEGEVELDAEGDEVMYDGLPDNRDGFPNDLQPTSPMAGLEFPDQYGKWQGPISNNDQLPGSSSPNQPLEYPSPTHHGMQDLEQPYQTGPHQQLENKSEFYEEDVDLIDVGDDADEVPRKLSMSSHRKHHSPARQTPNVQQPQGNLSRSQSVHEVLDLTGTSDEEENAHSDEDAVGEEDSNDYSDDGYNVEDEDGYENSRPSWMKGYHTDIPEGHIYDAEDEYDSNEQPREYESGSDDEEEDEEDEYDRNSQYDRSDDEGDEPDQVPRNGANAAPQGEPVTISLLSSDEEDEVVPHTSTRINYSAPRPAERQVFRRPEGEEEDSESDSDSDSDSDSNSGEEEDHGSQVASAKPSARQVRSAENSDESESDDASVSDSDSDSDSNEDEEAENGDPMQKSRVLECRGDNLSDEDGAVELEARDEDSWKSKPFAHGDGEFSDEKNIAPSRISRARSMESLSDDARRRSYSLDGASDEIDELVVESHRAKRSPSAKLSNAQDDSQPQQEKKIKNPRLSRLEISPPNVSSKNPAVDNPMDDGNEEISPTLLVTAEILDILASANSMNDLENQEIEKQEAIKTSGLGEEIADRMDVTMEEVTTIISAVSPKQFSEADEETEDKMEIIVDKKTTIINEVSTIEPLEAPDPAEKTEEPHYPRLPLEDDESAAQLKASLTTGASKDEELSAANDTQMTSLESTVSFEATQSSVNETQLTELTSITTSFEETKSSKAEISAAIDAETVEAVPEPLDVESSQVEAVDWTTSENEEGEDSVEPEATESFSEINKVEVVINPVPEPQPLPITPRRSQRNANKALNSPTPIITPQQIPLFQDESPPPEEYDPSAELALATFDSPSKNGVDEGSPEEYDASAELALANLIPPSKKRLEHSNPISSPGTTNLAHLKKSLRTDRGEYTILKNLRIKIGQKRDILAIATTSSSTAQQAKKAPKHWFTDFNITDPSVGGSVVTRVTVFRPKSAALPILSPGDGILLRNFKVVSQPGVKFSLRSGDDSGWAVLKRDGSVEERGPPVESGDEEFSHLTDLRGWFEGMDAGAKEVLDRAHNHAGDKGKGKGGK